MSRAFRLLCLAMAIGATTTAAGRTSQPSSQTPPPPGYVATIEAWRTQRDAALRADDGWLTLAGLHWLSEGPNTMGSDPSCAVPLPAAAPPRLGVLTLRAGAVAFAPAPGTSALINGRPAQTQMLRTQPGPYDVLTTGTVSLFVIKRGERFGVRVRDREHPARRAFTGTRWFPVSDAWRVTARFERHATPTTVMIANVLGSLEAWPSPGVAVFTAGGREHRLVAVLDGPDAHELFFVFRDQTTGRDTYGGGRFLYADMPTDGTVVLDFNKAHSPPCAFTPFATCPLPPRENTLAMRVEAGERDPHGHQ
jgi:uncharacterized protein